MCDHLRSLKFSAVANHLREFFIYFIPPHFEDLKIKSCTYLYLEL